MKFIHSLLFISFIYSFSIGQNTSHLDGNYVNATINNTGTFFNDYATSWPGYEIPEGSNKHCIYAASFWYGGMNSNNELKLSAQFYQANQDLFPGPYSSNSSYNDPLFASNYHSIWTVTSGQIQYHIDNYTDPSYVTPTSISTWPGNGDTTLGVSEQLAPYVDVNNDGFYIPEDGDYPDIKGCMASYIIMNDAADTHGTGGDIIGIEVHQMFYHYFTTDLGSFLNRTTFLEQRIINHGGQNIHDFYTSFFVDADIGNYSDDYVGCDSSRNMMFAYNGDADDESMGGSTGYGAETPSLGVISLSHNLAGSNNFNSGSSPNTPTTIYNVMKGLWADGSSIYYGGSGVFGDPGVSNNPTTFTYSDNPNDPSGWSEVTLSNPPGDRRIYMSVYKDTLASQAEWIQDYAILQAPEGSAQESVNYLIQKADSAIAFYQNPSSDCDIVASLSEIANNVIEIYPNPSTGQFTLSLKNVLNKSNLQIINSDGRIVYQRELGMEKQLEIQLKEPTGIYMLTINDGNSIFSKKIILE